MNSENKTKRKNAKKGTVFLKFCQFIYLSITNFASNVLWESASACSFSFVFSFIPILIIIFTVLTAVLNFSPELLNKILEYTASLNQFVNTELFFSNVLNLKSISLINIFLAVWMVMMARKLFVSIVRAMYIIFHKDSDPKSRLSQLLFFICEFLMVLLIIAVIIAAFIFNKFMSLPIFDYIQEKFPYLLLRDYNVLIGTFTYILLFISTCLIYKYVSRVNPRTRHCVIYAALSTVATFVVSFFLNVFLNTTTYNLIYGTISTVIIMMLKVYSFFLIFLFCAQMMFVSHNFDILLQAEIYLLPEYDELSFKMLLRRLLFINPAIIQTKENTLFFKADDIIYSKGDKTNCVYYIKSGTVYEISEKGATYYDHGDFFGESTCVLNTEQAGTVKAITPCEIMIIPDDDFIELLNVYPLAAQKALAKLSSYTEKISHF